MQSISLPLLLLLALSLTAYCSTLLATSHRHTYAVMISGAEETADAIAARNGFENLGKIGNLEDVYLFKERMETELSSKRKRKKSYSLPPLRQLRAENHVESAVEQIVQKRTKRLSYTPPSDPLWGKQWSLWNRGLIGGTLDMNVEPAWIQGFTGDGVVVAIPDDGVWYTHTDLEANFNSNLSWDFIDNDSDVIPPRYRDNHGTSCAGVVAMTKSNGICGVGVAYESQIAGLRMFDGDETTDAIEANALGFQTQSIDVYSSSWGPYDNGFTVGGPGNVLTDVLKRGAEEGRRGKGVIYVWASGNGGHNEDTCAMDGYVSSIYTIAVGSVDQYGVQASYDEECSSKLAVAVNHNVQNPNKNHVVTTDAKNKCRGSFKGTSAASPLVAGVIALVLQANNNLTWRDVQYLIVHTSNHEGLTRYHNLSSPAWTQNGAGLWVSHSFGFGAIDAEAMVTRARHWINVPEQKQATYTPDLGPGVVSANDSLTVTFAVGNETDIQSLEHVVIKLSLSIENYTQPRSLAHYNIMQSLFGTHFDQTDITNLLEHDGARRGDITISLLSPHGTQSILLPYRPRDFVNTDTLIWSFMSVLNWGENPVGEWKITSHFKSREGFVQLSELSVTMFGIADSYTSQNCSSQCRGECGRLGVDYCDRCSSFRDCETLKCLESCNNTTHYQYRNYCIPLRNTTGLHTTTSSVHILQRSMEFQSPTVIPTATVISGITSSSSYTQTQPLLYMLQSEAFQTLVTSSTQHTPTATRESFTNKILKSIPMHSSTALHVSPSHSTTATSHSEVISHMPNPTTTVNTHTSVVLHTTLIYKLNSSPTTPYTEVTDHANNAQTSISTNGFSVTVSLLLMYVYVVT